MQVQDDPYVILGVEPGATVRELRRARNQLLLHWHPDRSGDPAAADRAARINAAYEVLSDPLRRADYARGEAGGSLASLLGQPRPLPWTPSAPDPDKAAAQQRIVDRFKDTPRPAPTAHRRWSDTVTWPGSWRQAAVRLLARALPFAVLAVLAYLALPRLDRLPALVGAGAAYLPVYAGMSAGRGLLGRATGFRHEAWGRFTLSWVVAVAAVLALDGWVTPRMPGALVAAIHPLLPPAALVVAGLVVYGIARAGRRGG